MTKLNPNKLKQDLIAIAKDLDNFDYKTQGPKRYTKVHGADVAIPTSMWASERFRDLLDDIFQSDLQRFVSRTRLAQELIKAVKTIQASSTDRSRLAQGIADTFLTSFDTHKDFTVYVPIQGVEFLDDFEYRFNEQIRLLKHSDKNQIKLLAGLENENDVKQLLPICVEVKVTAFDHVKAMDVAVESTELLVHFLRLVDYLGWDSDDLGLRLPGYGSSTEGLYPVIFESPESRYTWQHKEPSNFPFEINSLTVKDFEDCGIARFGELLKKRLEWRLSEMEESILRAVVWFGESKHESDLSARFLKLMLAIECLLISNTHDPITATLRERVAFILEDDRDRRITIASNVSKLYDMRSAIVHHGSSDVSFDKLVSLEYIVFRLLQTFLTTSDWADIKDKRELENKILSCRYS